ncbi:MAG: L-seryl-tRNA(Sec) selenium transferase [Tepidiformaceae bacterium]
MGEQRARALPSVERVLGLMGHGAGPNTHGLATDAARRAIAEARVAVIDGAAAESADTIASRATEILVAQGRPSLRRVINASGVILQTNLGRAPLSERALAAMEAVGRGYSNLEFDLEEGSRGSRHGHVRELIRRTTGAQDGMAVNNNAAALFMVLQVFAAGREVIVSRGQAVEIGGGFRIPDVLRQSGAELVEVGTTNRTYTRDYEDALTTETAAILRVHTSNFRVVGFTAAAPLSDLATLARGRGVLLIDDLGSGCLVDTARYGLEREPTVQESLSAGSHLALFSGDKLLGGPQCGIIAGEAGLVAELRRHPLARALRLDKLSIAALNATLASYVEGRQEEEIPVWRMLSLPLGKLRGRARRWAAAAGEAGSVVTGRTMVGGGSLPGAGVPTWCAAVRPPRGADAVARALRSGDPAIVARVQDGAVLLDPRTVDPREDGAVAGAIGRSLE